MIDTLRKQPILGILLILGTLVGFIVYLTAIQNGSFNCFKDACGTYYWGSHAVDGFWHIAIMQHSFDTFPFTVPMFSGYPLGGYNYLLDLLGAPLQLFGFTPHFIYFTMFPIVWVFSFLALLVLYVNRIRRSTSYLASLIFFIFFSTGFYMIFSFYHDKNLFDIDGSGGAHVLTNMQFAYSLLGSLLVMYLLERKEKTIGTYTLLAVLVFLITGLKFYTGVIIMVFLGTYYLTSLFKKSTNKQVIVASGISLLCAFAGAILLIYRPFMNTPSSEPIFSFAPLALAHRLIEEPDRFYIPYLALARYTLLEGGLGPRLIAFEIFSILVYLFFEVGIRMIAYIAFFARGVTSKLTQRDIALVVAYTTGIALSLLLVQRGQWWNVIQFLYVAFFFMAFHSAETFNWMATRKSIVLKLVCIGIILCFLPFNMSVVKGFSSFEEHGKYVTEKEHDALKFLEKQPEGVFLALQPRLNPKYQAPVPKPMWYSADSTYREVFSTKKSYVGAIEILKLLDIDYESRLSQVNSADVSELKKHVDYIYSYGPTKNYCNSEMEIREHGTEIFNNEYVHIYSF